MADYRTLAVTVGLIVRCIELKRRSGNLCRSLRVYVEGKYISERADIDATADEYFRGADCTDRWPCARSEVFDLINDHPSAGTLGYVKHLDRRKSLTCIIATTKHK